MTEQVEISEAVSVLDNPAAPLGEMLGLGGGNPTFPIAFTP